MLTTQIARSEQVRSGNDGAPVESRATRRRQARVNETADERRARIERIRVQLQNGTYQADAGEIADALLTSGDIAL